MTAYSEIGNDLRNVWWRYVKYFILILVVSLPLVVVTSIDLSAYDASKRHDMSMELTNHTTPDAASFGRFFAWMTFLSVMFGAYYWFYYIFQTEDERPLNIQLHYKTYNAGEAMSRLLYDGAILYVVAGIRDKIWYPHQNIPLGVFLALVAGFSFTYAFIFHNLPASENITVTAKRVQKNPEIIPLIFLPAAAVISLAMTYHLMTAWRVSPEFFGLYVGVIALFLLYHVALYVAYDDRFHLHHWYVGLFAAHACIFNTDVSIVCQAAFIGIYVHGIAVFGPDSIIEMKSSF
jgi:hypothetical protein